MIRHLRLRNFKCFRDLDIDLAPLTLLAGLNGMGKSTVIQALLVLLQTIGDELVPSGLDINIVLNGDLIRLGTGRDVLHTDAEDDEIEIGLSGSGIIGFVGSETWRAKVKPEQDVLAVELERSFSAGLDDTDLGYQGVAPFLLAGHFQYLQAERIGPRLSYGTSDFFVRRHGQIGIQGEYTANYLALHGDQDIRHPELGHPKATSQSLLNQVEAWLDEVSPGTRLRISAVPDLDLIGVRFSFVTGKHESDAFRSTNVGFGLSYALPVLAATLAAKKDSLLLIENPEAHLHPRGQALLGDLLARAASAGIQVIVETHSDHVLNGIRLAVHGGRIAPQDVAMHYFERRLLEDRLNTS